MTSAESYQSWKSAPDGFVLPLFPFRKTQWHRMALSSSVTNAVFPAVPYCRAGGPLLFNLSSKWAFFWFLGFFFDRKA